MAPLRQHQRGRNPGGARTDNSETSLSVCRGIIQLGLMTGTRVHQATTHFVRERVIKTGLVASDADVDLICTTLTCFFDELCVGQHRPRERYHVGTTIGQNLLCSGRQIDAIGCHQWDGDFSLHFFRHPGEGAARY